MVESNSEITFPSGESLNVVDGPTGEDQEHYDPNNTGNPLLDTRSAHRSKRLSQNFTVGELARSGGRNFDKARIDPRLIDCLQKIRDRVGKPVIVTSGYRPYAYNVDIYKERKKKPTKSRHSSGQAADIKVADMTGMELAKTAIDVCGVNLGVGIDDDNAHIDVRGQWARWTYFGDSPASDRAIQEIDAYRSSRHSS